MLYPVGNRRRIKHSNWIFVDAVSTTVFLFVCLVLQIFFDKLDIGKDDILTISGGTYMIAQFLCI